MLLLYDKAHYLEVGFSYSFNTKEAYEEWKIKVARSGRLNGRTRETIVVYKGEEYIFDYCRQAINYFKEFKDEPVSVNWVYRGINPQHKDRFQFFGYEEEYKKYKENIKTLTL